MRITKFSEWRAIFRNEARDAYRDMPRRHPGDQITGFAILTDDDFLSFVPRADTAVLARQRLSENPAEGWGEKLFRDWELRWSTAEWSDIYDEEFPCTREAEPKPEEVFDVMMAFREQWFAQPGNTDHKFRQQMLRTMFDVLRDLDQEGLFGRGEERDQITLFLEISDSNLDPLVKLWSAAKLNPRKSRRQLTNSMPWVARMFISSIGWFGYPFRGPLVARSSPA